MGIKYQRSKFGARVDKFHTSRSSKTFMLHQSNNRNLTEVSINIQDQMCCEICMLGWKGSNSERLCECKRASTTIISFLFLSLDQPKVNQQKTNDAFYIQHTTNSTFLLYHPLIYILILCSIVLYLSPPSLSPLYPLPPNPWLSTFPFTSCLTFLSHWACLPARL